MCVFHCECLLTCVCLAQWSHHPEAHQRPNRTREALEVASRFLGPRGGEQRGDQEGEGRRNLCRDEANQQTAKTRSHRPSVRQRARNGRSYSIRIHHLNQQFKSAHLE